MWPEPKGTHTQLFLCSHQGRDSEQPSALSYGMGVEARKAGGPGSQSPGDEQAQGSPQGLNQRPLAQLAKGRQTRITPCTLLPASYRAGAVGSSTGAA